MRPDRDWDFPRFSTVGFVISAVVIAYLIVQVAVAPNVEELTLLLFIMAFLLGRASKGEI